MNNNSKVQPNKLIFRHCVFVLALMLTLALSACGRANYATSTSTLEESLVAETPSAGEPAPPLGDDPLPPQEPPLVGPPLIEEPPQLFFPYNQEEYDRQSGLGVINAGAAFNLGYLGQDVTIALVGSGVLTTHVDLTANLLPGVRFETNLADETPKNDVTDRIGFGTHVAGIIGAEIDNDPNSIIGVAPFAKILPIQSSVSFDIHNQFIGAYNGFRYALTNTVVTAQVIQNSWTSIELLVGTITVDGTAVRTKFNTHGAFPITQPFFEKNVGKAAKLRTQFAQIATDITSNGKSGDVVIVHAAGDWGWNGGADDVVDFNGYVDDVYGDLSELGTVTLDGSGGWALAPFYEPALMDHFVNVVAVDTTKATISLAAFSDACGNSFHWCIAAPGINLTSTGPDIFGGILNDRYLDAHGTPRQAAAHVAGALAVMRSRFTDMRMTVMLDILFATADDLGDPLLYGHGLLNLGKAITVQNNINLQAGAAASSHEDSGSSRILLRDSYAHLSPALAEFGYQLAGVSVAAQYLEGKYYGTGLDTLLTNSVKPELPSFGDAAAQMLESPTSSGILLGNLHFKQDVKNGQLMGLNFATDYLRLNYTACKDDDDDCAKSVWSHFNSSSMDDIAPYFATDKQHAMIAVPLGEHIDVFAGGGFGEDAKSVSYQQLGVRWHAFSGWYAEYSRITENDTVLGSRFNGGLGLDNAHTDQFKLSGRYDITDKWYAFGLYELGIGEASRTHGSLFDSFSYRYNAWRFGISKSEIFRSDDEFRIGLRHHGGIEEGRASITRGVLTDGGQLRQQTDKLRWSNEGIQSLYLGYAVRRADSTSIGFGFEHIRGDRLGSEDAISFIFKKNFRF